MNKNRDILITTERRSNYLYQNQSFFIENLLEIEMKKTEILTNKPLDLGLSTLA